MNTSGPFYISPYTGAGLIAHSQIDVPIVLGSKGFLEVINTSNFGIYIALQSMGTVYQEARSKVLYTPVQTIVGTQMLHLSTAQNANSPTSARYIRLPVAYMNGETGFFGIWVNTYEEGEIQWYAPVALADPPSESSYYATHQFTGAGSFSLPTTETFFNNITPGFGTCDLLGFDLTGDTIGTNNTGTLTISNLNNQPDGSGSLVYQLGVSPNNEAFPPLIVRYPTPIPNFLGRQITFTIAGFAVAVHTLNAYYSLT